MQNIDMKNGEGIDLANITEYAQYSMQIERTFAELQKELAVCYNPKEIALKAMQVATEFYDADWCGIFEVDLELRLFTPFWWFYREHGAMVPTLNLEFEVLAYQRWIDALNNHTAMVIEDIEEIRDSYPEEYALYKRLKANNLMAVPFWKGPAGFLVLRNPKRYTKQTSFFRMLNYVIANSVSEYFMIETSKLSLTSPRITSGNDVYISLFGEMKIIGPKGVLTESELKSPKISRVVVYLLLTKKNGVSPREMADAIWPEEDADNVVKNFKGLIYRLQQAFALISDCRLVESTPNGYQLNPKLNIVTDFQLFEKKKDNAINAGSTDQKIELLKKAVNLYAGTFFHSAANEHWVMATAVEYQNLYIATVGELLKMLFDDRDFASVHHFAAKAIKYAPHCEDLYFWMIRSLVKSGHTEMARGELRMAQAKLLNEEYDSLLKRLKETDELGL